MIRHLRNKISGFLSARDPVSDRPYAWQSVEALIASADGQVRLERHTLSLLVFPVLLMIVLPDHFFTATLKLPASIGPFIEFSLLLVLLTLMFFIERRISVSLRANVGETLPPLQLKLMQLIAVIVLLALILKLYNLVYLGPGKQVYWFAIIVLGMSILLFGVFTHRFLLVLGLTVLLLGFLAMFVNIPFLTIKAFTLSVLLVVSLFTLLDSAFTLEPLSPGQAARRLTLVLLCIMVTTLLLSLLFPRQPFQNSVLISNVDEFNPARGAVSQAVHLPVGTVVNFDVEFAMDVFEKPVQIQFNRKLARSIDVMVENNTPTGLFRVEEKSWQKMSDVNRRFERQHQLLEDQSPWITRKLTLDVKD